MPNATETGQRDTSGRPKHSTGWRSAVRRLAILLLALLVPYLTIALMLTFLQRTLIFHPYRAAAISPSDLQWPAGQVHAIEIRSHDGLVLRGWHVLADGHSAQTPEQLERELTGGRPLVLYFPGNAGNRTFRGPEIAVWTSLGADVFLFDYRGYGDNPGSPNEEHLAKDAHAIWGYATDQRGVPSDRIILYGESLGGAVAVRLAAELSQSHTPPGALVVRSGFSSLGDVGAYHYPWLPVRWALTDRFAAGDHIRHVTCPVLLLHGAQDTIVPLRFAQALYAAAPDVSQSGVAKRLVVIPDVDHNDVIFAAEEDVRSGLRDLLQDADL